MKKLLLSLALVASLTASATETTLEVKDAKNIDGTDVPEEAPNDKNKNGVAHHIQPLKSLTISDYKFEFTKGNAATEPAYYWPMSTNPNGDITIRVYGKNEDGTATGNSMTITAPEGVTFKSIVFTGSNGKANGVVDADCGTVKMPSANEVTWTSETAVSSVKLTFGQSYRFKTAVVSTEAAVVDPPSTGSKFSKATTLENGKYIFVVDSKIAVPIATNRSYGYMYFDVDAVMDGADIVTDEANALTVAVADGKVTLLDPAGRYYGMDDSHFTSFQCYTELNDYCYWTYEFVGETIKMTNTKNTECFICKPGTYNNIAPAKNPTTFVLPLIYKLASGSGVDTVEAEVSEDAPVVYYNLQGVRVENPEQGLYIRVQGNKATKVAIR